MRIVLLANSKKMRGRCIAGIQIDHDNQIVLDSYGHPVWIRPILENEHFNIPIEWVQDFLLLNVIELK